LGERLARTVSRSVAQINGVREYEYVSEDADGDVFALPLEHTDFLGLLDQLREGQDAPMVRDLEEIRGAWGYVIHGHHSGHDIWGFRHVRAGWSTKRDSNPLTTAFKGARLVLLADEPVFRLDAELDAIAFEDTLLVLDKSGFETGLNYRDGVMERGRECLAALAALGITDRDSAEAMAEAVGPNLRYLRKLAAIQQSGHVSLPFIQQLTRVSEEEGWGLEFPGGKLRFRRDQLDLIITVLGNNRLKSLLDGDTYDVPMKRKALRVAERPSTPTPASPRRRGRR